MPKIINLIELTPWHIDMHGYFFSMRACVAGGNRDAAILIRSHTSCLGCPFLPSEELAEKVLGIRSARTPEEFIRVGLNRLGGVGMVLEPGM